MKDIDLDQTGKPFLPGDLAELPPGPESVQTPSRARGGSGGMTRRRFLKRAGLAIGALALGGAADALAIEPHWFEVTRRDIAVPNLPPRWDGATIAQISDIHIGPYSTLDQAREIVDMCNDLRPDIIALTGDYVSKADAITRALIEVLRDLRCPRCHRFAGIGGDTAAEELPPHHLPGRSGPVHRRRG